VTAEGVETEQQLNLLRQEGCDEVQGFLLGRPMQADDVAAYIDASRHASRWEHVSSLVADSV
jgi:EAL domain-containing protein (putative c-di-GMP-specific phosphodiesterase class I)